MANGITFPSISQRDRYLYLFSLEQQGVIAGLDPHPPSVLLIPPQATMWNGKLQDFCYTPDFIYAYNGIRFVEEHKPHSERYWSITLKVIESLGVYANFYVSKDVSSMPARKEKKSELSKTRKTRP
jgi:hypothetical protein